MKMKTKTREELLQEVAEEVKKIKEKENPEKPKQIIKNKLRCGHSVYVHHNFEDPYGKFHFKI